MREIKIHLNQVGYKPSEVKRAIVVGECERFEIVDVESGGAVYQGDIQYGGYSAASDDYVRYADFTDFTKEGRYCIAIDGNYSYQFSIGEKVLVKARNAVLKAIFYNRCGCSQMSPWAGLYSHTACHSRLVPLKDDESILLDVDGGWHDAGDYGRYTMPGAVTLARLMYAYLLNPHSFEGELGIPESGNGIPDILNECRWELDWFFKIQRDDGAFYHKVTGLYHAGFAQPHHDNNALKVFCVSPEATASAGAAMALAARLFANLDAGYAEKCKRSAVKAWEWLMANEDALPYDKNDGSQTGIYNAGDKAVQTYPHRIWLACELYNLTGDGKYFASVDKYVDEHSKCYPSLQEMLVFADFALITKPDGYEFPERLENHLRERTHKFAQEVQSRFDSTKYEIPAEIFETYSLIWMITDTIIMLAAHLMEPKPEYERSIHEVKNYLFGKNALGYSFVTGIGTKFCNNVHMAANIHDGVATSQPGWLAGGPGNVPGLLQTHNTPTCNILNYLRIDTPPMKGYVDEVPFYRINEPTIYGNAAAVLLLGYVDR